MSNASQHELIDYAHTCISIKPINLSSTRIIIEFFTNTQHWQQCQYWHQSIYYMKTKNSSNKMLPQVSIEPLDLSFQAQYSPFWAGFFVCFHIAKPIVFFLFCIRLVEITPQQEILCSDRTFFCQNAFETVLFEHEQTSLLQLITRVSQV